MHVDLGGYHVRDIEFTAAFDIDVDEGRQGPRQAIWAGQNNTIKFAKVPSSLGVPVHRGMTHDGLGKYLKEKIKKAPGPDRRHRQDPPATRTPTWSSPTCPSAPSRPPSGTSSRCSRRAAASSTASPCSSPARTTGTGASTSAGLPIVGDDIKSQVGATIVHRTLARLFAERGVKVERTSQLNVGGNMDFYNMLERERLESKKISKTNAVTSMMDHELPAGDVHVGPVGLRAVADRPQVGPHPHRGPGLRRRAPEHGAQARGVGLARTRPGIVIDAVRCCKLALNHGLGGQLDGPSSYLMKSPHRQRPDEQARLDTEAFIASYAKRPGTTPKGPSGARAKGRRSATASRAAGGRAAR